jgi:hypothetical protein
MTRVCAPVDASSSNTHHARAAQRLARAKQALDRLGWRGRRRREAELHAEIELQRQALRLADDKLAQL